MSMRNRSSKSKREMQESVKELIKAAIRLSLAIPEDLEEDDESDNSNSAQRESAVAAPGISAASPKSATATSPIPLIINYPKPLVSNKKSRSVHPTCNTRSKVTSPAAKTVFQNTYKNNSKKGTLKR